MPSSARRFGKLVDTSVLKPGDLLLSRYVNPDSVSMHIESCQRQGGYDAHDACWTHASMYVAGGILIEADLDSRFGGRVREKTLAEYCDGEQVLLFRRPKLLKCEDDRTNMVRRAYLHLHERYALCRVCWGLFKICFLGHRFYHTLASARQCFITCSELYSEAYAAATSCILADENGRCAPAFLSRSEVFEDIDVNWLRVA